MNKSKNPNYVLAERIQGDLISQDLISNDNKDFLARLAEGKLKDSDWRTVLLDRLHRKRKSS